MSAVGLEAFTANGACDVGAACAAISANGSIAQIRGGQSVVLIDAQCAVLAATLKTVPTITEVDFSGTHITETGLQHLASGLVISGALRCLRIDNISDQGCAQVASIVQHNPSLVKLDLSCSEDARTERTFTAEGIRALAPALQKNASLTSIDLSHNHIGAQGAERLCDVFTERWYDSGRVNTITALALFDCALGDEGLRHIVSNLASSTLTALDVGSNGLTYEGMTALNYALCRPNSLTKLSLISNHIGDIGVHLLKSALLDVNREPLPLRHLDLGSNSITGEGVHSLLSCFNRNRSLATLNLQGNAVYSERAMLALERVMERNHTITYFNREVIEESLEVDACVSRNKRNKHLRDTYWLQLAPLIASFQAVSPYSVSSAAAPFSSSLSSLSSSSSLSPSSSSSSPHLAFNVEGKGADSANESLYTLRNSIRYSSILPCIRSFLVNPLHYPYDQYSVNDESPVDDVSPAQQMDALGCSAVRGMSNAALDAFLRTPFMTAIEEIGARARAKKRKHSA